MWGCLFEMRRALVLPKDIAMGFSQSEAVHFAGAVQTRELNIEEIVKQKVDVRKAKATRSSDLQMVREKI
jgi:hypothetical protein